MNDVVYRIVEHDGGWAYKLGDVFSETFPDRQSAALAARRVAEEQRSPGEDEAISWEDERGIWHDEAARGIDRPNVYIADDETPQRPQAGSTARNAFAQGGPDRTPGSYAVMARSAGGRQQPARGQSVPSSLAVMLLTIAVAYVLSILVERKA